MKNNEITYVLSKLDEIEYIVRRPSDDVDEEGLAYPTIIVWRYKKQNQNLIIELKKAVRAFKGDIKWTVYENRNNLVLLPERLNIVRKQQGHMGNLETALYMKCNDPDFGKKANKEIYELAEFINCYFQL